MLSRDLARAVIAKLKLDKNPEFDPALNGTSPIKAILGRLGLIKDPASMTPEERVPVESLTPPPSRRCPA